MEEYEYYVKKVIRQTIYCPNCNGRGYKEKKEYHNRWETTPCLRCNQTGRVTEKKEEWIPLYEALREVERNDFPTV